MESLLYLEDCAQLVKRPMRSNETAGLHAGTIETLLFIAENGYLPGSAKSDRLLQFPQKGDIYCIPNSDFPIERYMDEAPDINEDTFDESITAATSMAEWRGQSHAFLSMLGLDIGKYHGEPADLFTGDPRVLKHSYPAKFAYDKFRQLGFTRREIERAVRISRHRKGVVFGIRTDALDRFPPTRGDASYDFRLSTRHIGLDIDFLSGIILIGPQEQKIFNRALKENR